MEERNLTLHDGLSLMYRGNLIAVIAALCVFIPIVNLFALVAILVGGIMEIIGLVKVRNLHSDYMSAVAAMIAGLVVGLFANDESSFGSIMGVANNIIGLFQYYFVIRATNSLLREAGRDDVAAEGDKAWKLELGVAVLGIVCVLLALIVAPVALIGALFAAILSVISLVIYLGYLKKSMDVFGM